MYDWSGRNKYETTRWGSGGAVSPTAGSGAEPREPNAFQQKYNENGLKLLTIGGEQAYCRTVAKKWLCRFRSKKLFTTGLIIGPAKTGPTGPFATAMLLQEEKGKQ